MVKLDGEDSQLAELHRNELFSCCSGEYHGMPPTPYNSGCSAFHDPQLNMANGFTPSPCALDGQGGSLSSLGQQSPDKTRIEYNFRALQILSSLFSTCRVQEGTLTDSLS